MDVSAELRLSFYRNVAMLNEKHGVALVQHIETKKVFVKKTLTIGYFNILWNILCRGSQKLKSW